MNNFMTALNEQYDMYHKYNEEYNHVSTQSDK